MPNRILSVMLISLLFLTACEQSGLPDVEGVEIDAIRDNINFSFTPQVRWVSANPGNRWFIVGRDLATSNISTKITLEIEAKASTGQSLEEVLTILTAQPYTIEELEDGSIYARGSSLATEFVIFRDFPDFVVTLTVIDALSESIDPRLIADWERIALEGDLLILE